MEGSYGYSAGVGQGGYGDALVTSSATVHAIYGGGTGEGVNLLGDARNSIYYTKRVSETKGGSGPRRA